MTQAHLDTRVLRKAAGPMIDAQSTATVARARVIREARNGRLVYVCAWCVAADVKESLSDLENLSHGVCSPCLSRETGGLL